MCVAEELNVTELTIHRVPPNSPQGTVAKEITIQRENFGKDPQSGGLYADEFSKAMHRWVRKHRP